MGKSTILYGYILSLVLFNCWGCTQIKDMAPSKEINTARELFLQKKYQNAVETFSQIQRQTPKESLQQKALLGEVCSRILLATNKTQSRKALQLWQTWCKKRRSILHREDLCTFLTPVMEKWSHSKQNQKSPPLPQHLLLPKESDLSKAFANQKKKLKKLRNQIKEKDQKIEELNKKLKALEDINQEIDQKKKGIDFQ